ncbi:MULTISPECIES: hypothetical protein [unclassified Rathayibacter]|uniref:hypothetical protein n=1 Tax=unclassified Rathayibacter TaxID=2609250 RepID=UPI0006FC38B1|nr:MULTISPECIES: hypothetical protein [unclassified Rathayibacter]KQQ05673.1 hypothetical protein ASF42_03675 [Rathayibacter sp. Leaf294]KQS13532.1 hypothetical protein ASG06_03685 [Rathayibacter sp. Leaf185]
MRRLLPWIVPAAGLALIIAGLVVGVTAPGAVSFGWFAYAPLSETMFSPSDAVVMSRGVALAWVLAVLGALLLAFSAGRLLAVRRERRR